MASELSAIDKIKYFFCAVGGIVGGAIIISGPDTMPEEIPFHVPLGLGFVAFGILMFVALFSVRVKALLVAIISGIFSAAGLFTAFFGDLNILHAALIGVISAIASFYVIYCLVSVFTGKDPT